MSTFTIKLSTKQKQAITRRNLIRELANYEESSSTEISEASNKEIRDMISSYKQEKKEADKADADLEKERIKKEKAEAKVAKE